MTKRNVLKEKEITERELYIMSFDQEKIENTHNKIVSNMEFDTLLLTIKTILGYKITMLKENTFLLKSVYAYTDDDVFCIRLTENNSLHFVDSSYLREWAIEYKKYVVQGKSISAFLSAVNLNLFERKTFDTKE